MIASVRFNMCPNICVFLFVCCSIDFMTEQDDGFMIEQDDRGPNNAITRYFRVRVVALVNGRYLTCSCGKPARRRVPCRHIFAVLQRRHKQMYSIRWYALFQHCYGRVGHEKMTEHFNVMIAQEATRTPGEDVLVEGLLTLSPPETQFPVLHTEGTEADLELAYKVLALNKRGIAVRRGQDDLPIIEVEEEDSGDYGDGYLQVGDDDGMEGFVSFSPAARAILGNNILAHHQKETVEELKHSSDHVYNRLNAIFKDLAKVVEDDPAQVDWLAAEMDKLHLQAIAHKQQANQSKDSDSGHQGDLNFSQSGTSKQKVCKRKRGVY
jgi:hypothetical protein